MKQKINIDEASIECLTDLLQLTRAIMVNERELRQLRNIGWEWTYSQFNEGRIKHQGASQDGISWITAGDCARSSMINYIIKLKTLIEKKKLCRSLSRSHDFGTELKYSNEVQKS